MQKSTTESASWQKPLYGIKINQNLPEIPLKSGVLGRPGGGIFVQECFVRRVLRARCQTSVCEDGAEKESKSRAGIP